MKRILMIALALLITAAFVTTVLAQEKKAEKPAAAATDKPAAEKVEKKDAVKAEKAPKAKAMTFKGEFVSADAAAKTIMAKNDKGEMTFDVAKIKKMAEFKAGDMIAVSYMEKDGKNVAKSVKAAKKEMKKEMKKDEKPAEKPAAAPEKPAAAPAPKK